MSAEHMATGYARRRVIITGGLGFIGSNLAHRLVDLGANVLLIDSLIPAYGGNLFNIAGIEDRVTVNVADVRDRFAMDYLVKDREIMFNLAGTLSHIDSMTDPFTDLEINCRSQLSILEACRANNPHVKIVFAGTRGQYGRAKYMPVDENHPLNPTDVNGINNNAGEAYHILYSQVHRIRSTSLRLTNTYGPRHQMRHHKQGIINWFVRQALEGSEISIFGDGSQVRDTNYVDDVIEALLLAGICDPADGEVFNLGGHPAKLLEIVEIISSLTGARYRLVPFPDDAKAIEIGDYVADHSKAERVLGWHPTVPLESGLKKTVDFYRQYAEYYW